MGILFGYLAIMVAVGAILCFKGRDLFRPALAIFAFWLVYSGIMGLYQGNVNQENLIIAVLAGLVAALLSGFIVKLGLFLAGMTLGLGLGWMSWQTFPQIHELQLPAYVYIAIVTILVAVLTVKSMDLLVPIVTAGLGSILMAIPCGYMLFHLHELIRNIDVSGVMTIKNINADLFTDFTVDQTLIIMVVAVILFIVGLTVQFKTNKKIYK